MKKILIIMAILAAILSATYVYSALYQTKVYTKQGGDEMVVGSSGQITVESGGEIEIESGGTIDVESGGYLKMAGSAITSNATELNYLDGATVGSVVSSKAIVASTSKTVSGLKVKVHTIDADSTLLSAQSGDLFSAISLDAKRTYTLPTAAAGLTYRFVVDDTDSLLVTANTGDYIVDGTTNRGTFAGVAASMILVAVDTTYWYPVSSVGTWTKY